MKVEVGKYYLTRDGKKVGPMALDIYRVEKSAYVWMGACDREGRYSNDGIDGDAPGGLQSSDLIAEWTDTPEVGTSSANQGPVREVTTVRKEIVPGVYGKVCVSTHADRGTVSIGIGGVMGASYVNDHGAKCFSFTADELTAAIATLTQIRNAMADSSAT